MKGGGWLLLAGSAAIGALNYGYTIALIYLLSPASFSQVAAVSSLLLLAGTAASATIPWVLARELANDGDDTARRRAATGFAVTTSGAAGVAAGVLICGAEARYAGVGVVTMTLAATVGIFVTAAGAGYLQGQRRFRLLAGYRAAEAVVKTAAGIGLVAVTRSPVAGVAGFAAGSLACAAWALWLMRRDLGPVRRATLGDRDLWSHAAGIGGIQVLVGLLQSLDVIVLSLTAGATATVAGYQGMLVLGRIPVYLSVALSTVAFPRLADRRITAEAAARTVRRMVGLYIGGAGTVAALIAVLPRSVLALILPDHYLHYSMLLLPLAAGGVAAGLLNLVTTFHQAAGRYRPAAITLTVAAAVGTPAIGAVSGNLTAVAWATAAVLSAAVAGTLVLLRQPDVRWAADAASGEDVLRAAVRHATRRRGRRQARVLLLGNYGNGNTGDESILAGLLNLAEGHPAEGSGLSTVTVVSRDPRHLADLHGVRAVPTVSWASLRAFVAADAVCIGGGGMFGAGLPPLVRVLPVAAIAARLLGKELYFLSLGAYASTPTSTKVPLQIAARLATAVTVRDPQSQQTMSGGPARGTAVRIVPDPSTLVPAVPADVLAEHIPHVGRPLILNVKAMPDVTELRRVMTEIGKGVAAWVAAGHDDPIYFVSMSTSGDYGLGAEYSDANLGEWMLEQAGLTGRAQIIGPNLNPAVARGLHAHAIGVIAMRLHSQIFAVTTGAPLLGVSFEPKSRLWLAGTGADELPTEAVTAVAVQAWLEGLSEPAGFGRARPGESREQVGLPVGAADVDLGWEHVVRGNGYLAGPDAASPAPASP